MFFASALHGRIDANLFQRDHFRQREIAKRASDVMTQTNKLEWWMVLKISLRVKAGVPKTLVKQKLRLHSLYFPQNSLMLTESCGEFSDLHSIFRFPVLRYCAVLRTVVVF